MNLYPIIRALTAIGIAASLWSCASGPSAPTHYYVLSTTQPAAASTDAASAGPTIELGRVILSEYLNQSAILTRTRANEVERAEYSLWAGPLGDEITRTLAENLSNSVPTDRIIVGGRRVATADFSVDVEIVSFERDAANTVRLVARWAVLRENGTTLVAMRRSVYQQSAEGSDYGMIVAAMSHTLGDLSADIAEVIKAGRRPASAAVPAGPARRASAR